MSKFLKESTWKKLRYNQNKDDYIGFIGVNLGKPFILKRYSDSIMVLKTLSYNEKAGVMDSIYFPTTYYIVSIIKAAKPIDISMFQRQLDRKESGVMEILWYSEPGQQYRQAAKEIDILCEELAAERKDGK